MITNAINKMDFEVSSEGNRIDSTQEMFPFYHLGLVKFVVQILPISQKMCKYVDMGKDGVVFLPNMVQEPTNVNLTKSWLH